MEPPALTGRARFSAATMVIDPTTSLHVANNHAQTMVVVGPPGSAKVSVCVCTCVCVGK